MKKILLFLSFIFLFYAGFAQSNPDEEILVFFNQGVQQQEEAINGKKIKKAKITKEELAESLSQIGITDSLLEVALPKFEMKDTLKILEDGTRLEQTNMAKLFKIKVPNGKKRKEMLDFLNSLPEVLYAEPNGKVVPLVIPSDTQFNNQWGLSNNANPGADIHAEAAWDIYKGNPNNIIAIIDGGVETTHEDLINKISGGDSGFGWGGHGTHVAGIAAAESNNSQGISGVDWNAKIHPQRIDNVADDAGTYQAIIDAVNFSSNAHVLNNSWGLVYSDDTPGRYSTTVRQAFAYAYKANRTSVVAMGNDQQTHPGVVNYPAGFGNVISVGATNNADVISGFSSQGSHIDVSAPGVGILSTINEGYAPDGGTSMAAPFVAGIASLLKGYKSNLANDDIENIIKLSADKVSGMSGQNFTNTYGFGRVNAEEALKFLKAPYSLSQLTATSGSAYSSTSQSQVVFMSAGSLASGTYIAKRHEIRKNVVFPDNYLSINGVWGRGVFTTGWNISNPNYGEGFCEVVPGTLTNTGATLRTYVYEIWSVTGSYIGYYPKNPSNVSFAYSILGVKAPTLSGPDNICSSGTTLTLNNLPTGAIVSWSVSSNLQILSSSNTGITVKANSTSTRGNGQINYNINSNYGQITTTKEVYVGKPYAYADAVNPICTNQYSQEYTLKASPGASSYRLVSTSPNLLINFSNEVTFTDAPKKVYFSSTSDGYYQVNLYTTNECGTTQGIIYVRSESCTGGGGGMYSVYPNPASSEVNIASNTGKTTAKPESQSSLYQQTQQIAKLFDFNGAFVKDIELDPYGTTKMDVSILKKGFYFLKIQVRGEEETHKIIVAH